MAERETPLHLFHVFSTFAVGGPQTRFVNLANALGSKYHHTILAMDGNYQAAEAIKAGVEFTLARMPVAKGSGISIANICNARRILSKVKPDILCTYNWGSIEWSLANRGGSICPHIHFEDGFGPDETPDRQRLRRSIMRRLALSRSLVVVPSQVLKKVATDVWGVSQNRIHYIPNGIDTQRFARSYDKALVRDLGISDELVVGTVAALRPEKNLTLLVRAFAGLSIMQNAQLVLVGEGPERGNIERECERQGVATRVILTGALSEPERVLGRFDVFALSSITEQMPNSVLEAMAAGLPVCATAVGDVKQMLAPENAAFVVPVEEPTALTSALAKLLQDQDLRRTIGRRNRDRVEAEFGLQSMVTRYDMLFTRTCRTETQ